MTEDFEPFGGTLRWFGETWGAPVCIEQTHIPTPIGMPCIGHDHMHGGHGPGIVPPYIVEGDQGITCPGPDGKAIAFHLRCWLHEIGADRLPGSG